MTNFAVGIYVARSLGVTAFGVFSLAWVTYGVVLNVSRGLATDPLMVRFSGVPDASWRGAVARLDGYRARRRRRPRRGVSGGRPRARRPGGARVRRPRRHAAGAAAPGRLAVRVLRRRRRAEGVRQRPRVGRRARPGHGGGGPRGQRGRLRARLGRVRHGGRGVRLPPVRHPAPDEPGRAGGFANSAISATGTWSRTSASAARASCGRTGSARSSGSARSARSGAPSSCSARSSPC